MASISGSVTIAGDPDDWIATAFDASTHAFAGAAAVSGGAYEITGLTAGKAYMVACRPKSGPAWAASRDTVLDDYTVPADPVNDPYVFKATTADGDIYAAYRELLLHCDGANNSTTFTDTTGKTVTANGNVKISTAQSKFGGASAYFDGNGDYLSIANTADFGFGTADFTWEAWIRIAGGAGTERGIFDFRTSGVAQPGTLFITTSSKLAFWYGSLLGGGGTALSLDTWYHVALSRSSGVMDCYLNGVEDFTSSASVDFGSSRALGIGGSVLSGNLGASPFNGYMDEIRVSKGVAIYTGTFTPPTAAFSDTAKTGTGEPTWPTTPGNTIADGDVTWTNMGALVQPLMQGPLIAA